MMMMQMTNCQINVRQIGAPAMIYAGKERE